jgi:MGT family glycosyltransferase
LRKPDNPASRTSTLERTMSRRRHILVALTPITGHVRPALPLVRALVAEGHDVVVYTGTKFGPAIRAAGATAAPVVRGRDLDDAQVDDWAKANGAPRPGVKRLQWDVLHHFVEPVPGQLADLAAIVAETRPDVLVVDNACIAGALAARVHAIPCLLFSVTPLAISSKDTAPFGTGLQPPRTRLAAARYAALRWLTRHVVFRRAQRAAREVVRGTGLTPPRGFFMDWVQTFAHRVLHTSVPSMEYPRSDLPGNVELVGPFLPAGDDAELPAWWPDVLAANRAGTPVVLVTQGTLALDPDRLLWPAIEALADEDLLVVATTASSDPHRVLPVGRPQNLRTAHFVPFDRLLPYVDVMVTNGGFGGVQQALAAGVPLVVAGRSEDKAEVGARVLWSGTGVVLPTDRRTDATTAQAVGEGVARVLDDPRYRGRARELAAEYAQYDGVARAVDVVDELLASVA